MHLVFVCGLQGSAEAARSLYRDLGDSAAVVFVVPNPVLDQQVMQKVSKTPSASLGLCAML